MKDETMKWDNFTAARVDGFKCAPGKTQSIFWDGKTPGLGVRVTAAGAKSYIFEASIQKKTIRITLGDTRTLSIVQAQAEATAYKSQTDKGIDPRKVKADEAAAQQAEQEARALELASTQEKQARESVTLADVWPEYVADRKALWSESHIKAHMAIIQAGGEKRKRSPKLTEPGPLASLAQVRLVDLTTAEIESWAKIEAATRASSGRLAMRLLKACLNWCAAHETYSKIVTTNAAKSSKARESLGKPKVRHDLLQREQLAAWFGAVKKIENPVISAYLQCLLLTGARRQELACLRWDDVDLRWRSIKLGDKIEDFRMIPLTPYVAHLLESLPRSDAAHCKEWVFFSEDAASGHIQEPRIAHNDAIDAAGLPRLTLHGLRRSFATLSEWTETPSGIAAQIQGHAPQGVREQNYIRRPLDLLRMWHVKIEEWILREAGMDFKTGENSF